MTNPITRPAVEDRSPGRVEPLWRRRLREEHRELTERCERLDRRIHAVNIAPGEPGHVDDPLLLVAQLAAMNQYRRILEARAHLEGIDLNRKDDES